MANILLAQVRAVLTTTPTRWEALTATLSPALLAQAPAPGEWSALGCLRHLLDTERFVFPVRVRAFLAGEDFPAWNPDTEGAATAETQDGSPVELATEFARYRYENLRLLEQLTPADFTRGARHAELGPVTLEQMLNEWATHDLNHTVQAERAIMQPFLRASGPWRGSFADHDVEHNAEITGG